MRQETKADIERRWLARLTLAILLATLGINLLSAYIRHVEAGLGCDGWPACYAQIGVHISEHSKKVAHAALAPQPIAKQTHRGVATALVVMVLLLVHRSRRQLRAMEALLPLAMAGVLLALAVIGPASYLKTRPAIATANLLGGIALAALSWRLYLSLSNTVRMDVAPWLRKLICTCLVLLLIQLALGAWLSANFAGLGCLGTDGCEPGRGMVDAFWYLRELALDANGRVIADQGTAAILVAHRVGAALLVPLLLLSSVLAARAGVALLRNALLVLLLVSIQAILGLGALTFSLPLAIVLAHSTVAALLLLAVLRLNYIAGGGASS